MALFCLFMAYKIGQQLLRAQMVTESPSRISIHDLQCCKILT
ncbi:protein of unknown function [Vibrio tapetis subsp. tapetis]|uniref:Uncharacterized protein n=1 Tax=Vibrio tapetis subsp. tapetis TaxID=1671868 RepID=A0A2N8Z870_9VIBR|nr:protein of unknown function [Vibrio tapetis subsp. tapetis]